MLINLALDVSIMQRQAHSDYRNQMLQYGHCDPYRRVKIGPACPTKHCFLSQCNCLPDYNRCARYGEYIQHHQCRLSSKLPVFSGKTNSGQNSVMMSAVTCIISTEEKKSWPDAYWSPTIDLNTFQFRIDAADVAYA